MQESRDHRAIAGITFGELLDLPFAEREEGGFRERKEEARGCEHEHTQHDQPRREIHAETYSEASGGQKLKLENLSQLSEMRLFSGGDIPD